MGLNAVEASLAGGADSFFGTKKEPGVFLRAITNQDGTPQLNCLVILEEVDRLANTKADAVGPLLRLLDPQAGEIYLEGAGKFDWSQVMIIALMNNKVKSGEINDRWEVINILGATKDKKEDILLNGILPNFLHSNVPGMNLTLDDLPQEKLKEILALETNKGFRKQESALRDLCSQTRLAKKQTSNLDHPHANGITHRSNGIHDNLEAIVN
jgi:ATP-dependent Lon protease